MLRVIFTYSVKSDLRPRNTIMFKDVQEMLAHPLFQEWEKLEGHIRWCWGRCCAPDPDGGHSFCTIKNIYSETATGCYKIASISGISEPRLDGLEEETDRSKFITPHMGMVE